MDQIAPPAVTVEAIPRPTTPSHIAEGCCAEPPHATHSHQEELVKIISQLWGEAWVSGAAGGAIHPSAMVWLPSLRFLPFRLPRSS